VAKGWQSPRGPWSAVGVNNQAHHGVLVRITTVFHQLLGVSDLLVDSVSLSPDGLVIKVRPKWRKPRCGQCGKRAPREDMGVSRRWRQLGWGSVKVWLEYSPRHVLCRQCGGVRVERVPWAAHRARFTLEFEEMTAYLAQVTDKTQVTKQMGISWESVGAIVERVVARCLDPERLKNLTRIGADEFSYKKRHRYLTTVVDHDERRIVWAAKGRSSETLEAFFDELGPEGCERLECVTIDMSAAFIKAIRHRIPNASLIFDRFHVQKLAGDALDEVRREQLRELRGTAEGKTLFRSRFALLKNPWNLNHSEKQKLSSLQETDAPLYRAYLLKETLARALDYKQPKRAEAAIEEWMSWASRSKLKPFVKVARTIRKYKKGVLAYVEHRLTNRLVEGLNNHLRVIARRAYGFHSAPPLIAMLFLCCGGIDLHPPLP